MLLVIFKRRKKDLTSRIKNKEDRGVVPMKWFLYLFLFSWPLLMVIASAILNIWISNDSKGFYEAFQIIINTNIPLYTVCIGAWCTVFMVFIIIKHFQKQLKQKDKQLSDKVELLFNNFSEVTIYKRKQVLIDLSKTFIDGNDSFLSVQLYKYERKLG